MNSKDAMNITPHRAKSRKRFFLITQTVNEAKI